MRKKYGYHKLDVRESMHHDIIMKITNKMQVCRLMYYSLSALHVSGDVFAHHQEHLTVLTACCKYSQVLQMMRENIFRNM